ncbi:hypothetical protein QSU92_05485 [Microbacterium sp. ET2]|uniref:hypothetical protein n=1 Tax=Microbacterium albipurpureum TaxID=3050384 RepID=UPI00259D2BB4|nr:hypothetical protein [Microbacterium sp. ET2 (Ac-2212)]WJL96629.1 hypothetical protein QSU92_05485 [Microbacterium sp. ET2 (Ac-2212)]
MTKNEQHHWFSRCGKSVQEWLLNNPSSPLPLAALDAVIGAGGQPVRRRASEDSRTEAYYLQPSDRAYISEMRRAGEAGGAR